MGRRARREGGASGVRSRCAVGAKRWPSTEAESAALVGQGHGGATQRSSVPSPPPSPSVALQPASTTVCRSSWRLSTGGSSRAEPPRVRTSSGAPPATGVADGSTLAIVGSRRYEKMPRRTAAQTGRVASPSSPTATCTDHSRAADAPSHAAPHGGMANASAEPLSTRAGTARSRHSLPTVARCSARRSGRSASALQPRVDECARAPCLDEALPAHRHLRAAADGARRRRDRLEGGVVEGDVVQRRQQRAVAAERDLNGRSADVRRLGRARDQRALVAPRRRHRRRQSAA